MKGEGLITYDDTRRALEAKGYAASSRWMKVRNNTHVRLVNDVVEVRLHGTVIARLHPDHVLISPEGFTTAVTIARINAVVAPYGWLCTKAGNTLRLTTITNHTELPLHGVTRVDAANVLPAPHSSIQQGGTK